MKDIFISCCKMQGRVVSVVPLLLEREELSFLDGVDILLTHLLFS